jgi:2-oxoglutarate ferredoxin oxidoreductase subunit delta
VKIDETEFQKVYVGKKFKIHIDENFCKGCGICVEFCPTKVYVLSSEVNIKGVRPVLAINVNKCTNCKICEIYCPDFAVHVEEV